ncbi:recombinase family protein [Corynebacterium capitovis]|uniref:recombinase family protein n=1 Tax=Corynebacterium capitovis TaxID=131081 RepID=UPI001FDECE6A|nr:recombinase family protein [Corynebacterium capitovis]
MSTARQEQSLDTQREQLTAVGCDPNHIYSDTIRGTKWQRPGLDAALAYARPADTILVTRLDRLGRNMVETVTTIADLAERDINVRVLEPELDTARPADKVVVNVMASLAEWERDLLIQRTREGVAHARTQGRVAGPKPKLNLEQKKQIRQLRQAGESVSALARSFNVSRQTIYRALEAKP